VGLKEAALDSPSFRSGVTHFTEQLDLVEKWLDGYIRCIIKLSHEVVMFENMINGFLAQTVPPAHISEAVLDHDYTLLAMKRFGDGARECWTATVSGMKKMEANMGEPIRGFLQNDLRSFKDVRRNFDQSQRQLDTLQSRYSAQAKTKEASSLREDAFQLHEARKAYLKASMDFSVVAPQLRMALDKILVKVFSDQWLYMRDPWQRISGSVERWGIDIDRVRGWSREMGNGEKAFQRELLNARKQIEENTELAVRPSRELEDYGSIPAFTSTSQGPSTTTLQAPGEKARPFRSEKQGWLNLRTVSGKPSRTTWLRRWFYVKNGIFGWLVQGSRSGGVEESERIGVLLCNVKPGNADDRRFVFEVKTKDIKIVLQAENQPELVEWQSAFDVAKQKALEDPSSTESPGQGPRAQDPAFAISPPSAAVFAASAADSGMPQHSEENAALLGADRSSTLAISGGELPVNRSSFDISSHRRSLAERDSDSARDPASRIIQKLDLHRKPVGDAKGHATTGLSGGGIASLIAASHTSMNVGPGALPTPPPPDTPRKTSAPISSIRDLPTSTLAPNTLANPPAPTNLSSAAVIVNGEQGIGIGRIDSSGGMPSGIMANIWGSTNWGHLNRLARGELKSQQERSPPVRLSNPPGASAPPSKLASPNGSSPQDTAVRRPVESTSNLASLDRIQAASTAPSPKHRKTLSLDDNEQLDPFPPEYPNYYPLQLKTQDAQFRLLFPSVRRDEKLLMVFKATWNPNEQQEFPGRVYVTAKEMYFYSNHCGMTLISSIDLGSIMDITAASGKDCDFIFCHLKVGESRSGYTRITIKTFLEPLNLLQRRLNLLVRNQTSQELSIEEMMKSLIKMEQTDPDVLPTMDSRESGSVNTRIDNSAAVLRDVSHRDQRDLRAKLLVDRGLYGDNPQQVDGAGDSKTFKLPKQPVVYAPSGMDKLAVVKEFDVSPKALFHVMFGDKSAVWQLLYHERQAQNIRQGPWTPLDQGYLRRDFDYQIDYLDMLRRVRHAKVEDHQMVDVANEHLLYVVSDRKKPWHLPYHNRFVLLTKVVITHLAKSKCKLAVYIKVDWTKSPPYVKSIIAEAALSDLELDALDLTDVIAQQVRTFASTNGRTKKAIQIFGQVGVQRQVSEFASSDAPLKAQLRRLTKRRTLTALAFESFASTAESVVTSVGQIVYRFLAWVWGTATANSIILAILGISILLNLVFSSTSTSNWWTERKARNFMARLGVGPDLTMAKAIYLHDLEDSTAVKAGSLDAPMSPCWDMFNSIMSLADVSAPQASHGLSSLRPAQTAAVRRLQRSRQHLGVQRHDLLVAMRVVNSIEREMMQAEWESWLLEESVQCKQLGAMIRRNDTELLAAKRSHDQQTNRMEQISAWHQRYCESCSGEQEVVGT